MQMATYKSTTSKHATAAPRPPARLHHQHACSSRPHRHNHRHRHRCCLPFHPQIRLGVVALAELEPFFGNLGLPPMGDPGMHSLFEELELTPDSEITFPEAIDIAQYLLQF